MKPCPLVAEKPPIRPLFIFAFIFSVYFSFFLWLKPGLCSSDVFSCICRFLEFKEAYGHPFDFFKASDRIDHYAALFHHFLSSSNATPIFYKLYIWFFYWISPDLAALGLFQALLASGIVTYCWVTVSRFWSGWVTAVVDLPVIFSLLNGIEVFGITVPHYSLFLYSSI